MPPTERTPRSAAKRARMYIKYFACDEEISLAIAVEESIETCKATSSSPKNLKMPTIPSSQSELPSASKATVDEPMEGKVTAKYKAVRKFPSNYPAQNNEAIQVAQVNNKRNRKLRSVNIVPPTTSPEDFLNFLCVRGGERGRGLQFAFGIEEKGQMANGENFTSHPIHHFSLPKQRKVSFATDDIIHVYDP